MQTGTTRRPTALIAGVVVTAGLAAAAIAWTYGQPPLFGREEAQPATTAVAAALGLLAVLGATGTAAHLFAATWLRSSTRSVTTRDETLLDDPALGSPWQAAHRWSRLWLLAAVLLVPVNAADSGGYPLSYALRSFSLLFTSTQTAQAWALTAVGALVVTIATARRRTWRSGLVLSGLVTVLALPTVVTAQVSVGADHDFATDAATIFTVATVALVALVWGASILPAQEREPAIERVRRVALVAAPIAVVARAGIAGYELAGTSPFASGYGVAIIVLLVALLALGALAIARRAATPTAQFLVVLVVGVQAAMVHLSPPRFIVPQSPQQNYLGFEVPQPPDLATIWLPGRPNLLLTVVAVTAITAYWVGYRALRRRGDRWPAARPWLWTAGWLVVLLVSASHVWAYSSATFSWHMAAHMSLNMLAPPLLVLAGPLTLLLRVTRPRTGDELPAARESVVSLLGSRGAQWVTNPLLIWLAFVGSFYALYFSGLFDTAMRYHWAHQLMTFHFLAIGCLFYGLAIGVDRPPRDVPPVARLAVVFAAMPFHAFFAIAVLAGNTVIGRNFYESLAVPWMTDLAADQQVGGQIAWATGELPLVVVVVSLVAQWLRQDQREARRHDRSVDAGRDTSLDAYNTMLASLAERDEKTRTLQ